MYICIYMYAYIHTHKHTHTHTQAHAHRHTRAHSIHEMHVACSMSFDATVTTMSLSYAGDEFQCATALSKVAWLPKTAITLKFSANACFCPMLL